MTIRPPAPIRPALAALPVYVPGARPEGRAEGAPVWKLSSNENPAAPLPAVREALAEAGGVLNRYPDMYASELVEALAVARGVKPAQVVVGNGSVAVLGHLLSATCDKDHEVVFAWRSFEAYPILVTVSGARPVRVPLLEGGHHDLAAMLAAITPQTRAVLLCSPNNPTGPALTHRAVEDFLTSVPPHVLVVLDEAYREYVRSPRAVDGLRLQSRFPNLVVLRTFSKAYGLAGLRVGYAVGSSEVIGWVRAVSTPFGVNEVAQRAAVAALRAEEEMAQTVAVTVSERERVIGALGHIPWLVRETEGNFYWLELGERTAQFVSEAANAGLLVRGFQGEGVRVTVGEKPANDLMLTFIEGFHSSS